MTSLIWFRRDLRVSDNHALCQAVKNGGPVVAVAFATPQQWLQHDDAPGKINFWLANLQKLAERLASLGIALHLETVADFAGIPDAICRFASEHSCDVLYFNREYEVNEQKRDTAVCKAFAAQKIRTFACEDRLLIEPGRVLTGSGGFYTVFTPFKRSWLGVAQLSDLAPLPVPAPVSTPIKHAVLPFLQLASRLKLPDWRSDLWPAGEAAAQARLAHFAAAGLDNYQAARDLPAVDGTSCLSPWLACGAISPRQCLAVIRRAGKNFPPEGTGAATWLNELIWRDFYYHVMSGFPRVSCSQPFQEKTRALHWRYDAEQLLTWQNGMTGYPIVDAAMRQLRQTGWMHNRLRMITAMFLSKHLLIDWRLGEKFFMQSLLDGDLAANNGGWQWSASTGTDAVPYFRIFNPFSQSQRFDTEGKFIKTFCPELAEVSVAALHNPVKLAAEISRKNIIYPPPVVDHKVARERALAAFKNL